MWAAASRVGALGGAQRVDAHRVLYAQSLREIRRTAAGHGVSRHGSQRDPIFGHFAVTEEFATTRPAFRWRHVVALARVTASEHGFAAPGQAEARRLLKLA